MRAAISACSVSGIPAAARSSPHSATVSMTSSRKSGLPSVFSRSARRVSGEMSPTCASASISCSLSVSPSGSSSIEVARTRPPPQSERTSRSSGRDEAENQERAVAHPVGHVLDQLEQRLLRPVDVLEDQDQAAASAPSAAPTRARPTRSPAGSARRGPPRGRRSRGRAGRRRHRPGSTGEAFRSRRRADRRRRCRQRP